MAYLYAPCVKPIASFIERVGDAAGGLSIPIKSSQLGTADPVVGGITQTFRMSLPHRRESPLRGRLLPTPFRRKSRCVEFGVLDIIRTLRSDFFHLGAGLTRQLIIVGKRPGEVSIREASRRYGIPATTISGWHKAGLLRGRRSGQYVLVDLRQLLQIKERWDAYIKTYGHARGFSVGKKPRP